MDIKILDITSRYSDKQGKQVIAKIIIGKEKGEIDALIWLNKNIDRSKITNGNGVFVYDNGEIACRGPP